MACYARWCRMQQARVPGTLGTLRIAALLVLLSPMFPLITAAKTLMIFAPHPDDEALMASGIMYSALSRGDTVKVVVMTNGDAGAAPPGTSLGTTRQGETVTGMSTLGLSEQNIIFLGYGDGMLMQLQNSSFPTAIYTSYARSNANLCKPRTGRNGLPQLPESGSRSLQSGHPVCRCQGGFAELQAR